MGLLCAWPHYQFFGGASAERECGDLKAIWSLALDAIPVSSIVWQMRGKVQQPIRYPRVRPCMRAVCKTLASALPAIPGPAGPVVPLRAGGVGCALAWLIWAP